MGGGVTIADFATKTGGSCDGTGKGGDDIGADITLVGTGAETPDPPASRITASGTAGWR
ncbi:MAG TPA: hypothetical protein PKI10_15440 [Syntrophorhabdus sp.]|nr:hypothetical protein [Syntrophorhabdus sp.]